jgi:hypothetical protein
VVRRIIGNPGVQLFVALLAVALIAERRLLGTGPLDGGALVPAWGSSSQLWSEYIAGFHSVGLGSAASTPPYVAVVAALATVLDGQSWLAVSVLLLGCVPLAGLTAYLATRRLVTSMVARVLLAASYALLPVAMGAVAAGHLGTAFAFVMLPLIGISAGRMLTGPPRLAGRAAWATALLVSLAAAFAPVIWVLAAALMVVAVAARRWLWPVTLVNAAIVVVMPFAALFPWSLHLLSAPSAFLAEAGVGAGGLTAAGGLPASSLLMLSPGGPGLPPVWATAGIALAVVAALLPHRRGVLVATGWAIAVAGYILAIVTSRTAPPLAGGGHGTVGWPGAALAVAAVGLLIAAAPAADWLAGRSRAADGESRAVGESRAAGGSTLAGKVVLAAAATAPVLAAVFWVAGGVRGPVSNAGQPLLPAFVAASSNGTDQYRTLVLRPSAAGALTYTVLRQRDPILGEPELTGYAPAEKALSRQVAALGAPDGADAGDPGSLLGTFGIRWVMLPGPVDPTLAERLNASVGLVPVSSAPSYDLWQVAGAVGRVRVIAPDGTVSVLASQPEGVSGVPVPASGGILELAEPYGGWTATVNGTVLKPVAKPVDGWAQGFVLPAGRGTLTITRDDTARELSLVLELVVLLAVCVLALPGKRADPADDVEALAAVRAAQQTRRVARAEKAREVRRAAASRVARRAAPAVPGNQAASDAPDDPVSPSPVTRARRARRPGRHGLSEAPQAPEVAQPLAEVPGALLTDVVTDADEPPVSSPVPPWETTMPPAGETSATGGFPADTGGFPAASGDFPAATGDFPAATGGFPAATGGFPAATGGFPAAPDEQPPSRSDRPERHSHRAGRHGKPAKPAKAAKPAKPAKQAKPGRRRRGSGDS